MHKNTYNTIQIWRAERFAVASGAENHAQPALRANNRGVDAVEEQWLLALCFCVDEFRELRTAGMTFK